MEIPHIPKPARLRREFGLRPRTRIGQHFLTDAGLLKKIVDCARIQPGVTSVIEVGMGPGYLTAQLLAARPYRLIPVELDERFFELHLALFRGHGNLVVHYGDILKLDLRTVLEKSGATDDLALIGNIPYQITSQLLFKIWNGGAAFRNVILTVQREVARRLVCAPGSKEYGALTVKARYYCEPEIVFELPRRYFTPPPKVDSAVVSLTPRPRPRYAGERERKFFALLNGAFAQRRKTLINSLLHSPPFPVSKARLLAALPDCGIDERARAEMLSAEQFYVLFERLNTH